MPRNAAGLYSLPLPPVIPNTVIESDWANTTTDDLANAISDSLSRTGQGGMTAPFRIIDGTAATPSLSFINEPSSGLFRQASGVVAMSIQGVAKQTWNTNGTTVIGTTTLQGDISITGVVTLPAVVNVPAGGINFTGGFVGIGRAPTAQLDVAGTPASTAQVCALVFNGQSNVTASLCSMSSAMVNHGPVQASSLMLSTGSGNTPLWIGNWLAGTGQISFMTNAAERARLTDLGWMSLGKAGAPNAVLDIQQTPGPAATGITSILLNNSTLGVTMNMSVASASYSGFPLVAGSGYISVGSGNVPMWFGQTLAGTGFVGFMTNALERMRITPEGNIGIAMTNPPNYGVGTVAAAINAVTQSVFDLAVGGVRVWSATTQSGSAVAGTVTNIPWNIITNGLTRFQFEAAGKVVVGTAAGLGQFTVHYQGPSTNGLTISEATDSVASNILCQRAGITGNSLNFRVVATIAGSINHPTLTTTAYNTSSDARLKKNIRPVKDVGKIIDNIPVVSFDWKTDGIHVPVGLIAQDVHGVFPQAVHEGHDVNEDPWMLDHSKMVPLLLKEIQSLRERVNVLEIECR